MTGWWCQIGARIRRGETVRAALLRHFERARTGAGADLPDDPHPDDVTQWFPEEIPIERDGVGYGHTPRQQALAALRSRGGR
ncbi:MAG: hypothetical protein QOH14_2037 [Pseudonocardiales bacterium]|jgi:hypothetical protein|nr:hypothetical protein [Pseudonocardiales bacterium]